LYRSRDAVRRRRLCKAGKVGIGILALAALLLLASVAVAQGGGYDLSWWTADTGGVTFSEANGYSLGATASQPDAGVHTGVGSLDDPYENIKEAIANASDGATLVFRAGSVNTFSGDRLIINRLFTPRGWDVIVGRE
jgi:hypothetical protein